MVKTDDLIEQLRDTPAGTLLLYHRPHRSFPVLDINREGSANLVNPLDSAISYAMIYGGEAQLVKGQSIWHPAVRISVADKYALGHIPINDNPENPKTVFILDPRNKNIGKFMPILARQNNPSGGEQFQDVYTEAIPGDHLSTGNQVYEILRKLGLGSFEEMILEMQKYKADTVDDIVLKAAG